MKYAHRNGFALAEVLVAVFVLAILSVAVFSTATVGIKTALHSEFTTVAQGLAEDEAAKISLMAYDDVVIGGGLPVGTFLANGTITQNGQPYDITRTVTLVDDPVNGTVTGTLTNDSADYKQVDIVLTPPGLPTRPVELTTLVIRQVAPATPVGIPSGDWKSVTYGNGTFVAVASGGDNRVMTSSDGVTWLARSAPTSAWQSVTFGNGLFVAVSDSGLDHVMTSSDGITWTAQSAPGNTNWKSVVYGDIGFVAVAPLGISSHIMSSLDGFDWYEEYTDGSPVEYASPKLTTVGYANGFYVAIASRVYGGWSHHNSLSPPWRLLSHTAEANTWTSVTFGNGKFVVVGCGRAVLAANDCSNGSSGSRIITAPDGQTIWTARSAPEQNSWRGVTYGSSGGFVAVASDGMSRVMTSSDGITWLAQSAPASAWQSVAYDGTGLYVAVANSGDSLVMTSSDGVSWTAL